MKELLIIYNGNNNQQYEYQLLENKKCIASGTADFMKLQVMTKSKLELETLYKTNTLKQIAEIMNISYNKTREIFYAYKIKLRNRGTQAK